jgi:hypothetical protein
MIYDSFTITVLATLENLASARSVKAVPSSGRPDRPRQRSPVNLDGGGLSSTTRDAPDVLVIKPSSNSAAVWRPPGEGRRDRALPRHRRLLGLRHSGATLTWGGLRPPGMGRPIPRIDEDAGFLGGVPAAQARIQRCALAARSATTRARSAPSASPARRVGSQLEQGDRLHLQRDPSESGTRVPRVASHTCSPTSLSRRACRC